MLSGHSYLFCDPAYFGKHILQLCEVKLVESIDQIFCIFFSVFFLSQLALVITERRVLNPFNYGSLFLPLILLVFISSI